MPKDPGSNQDPSGHRRHHELRRYGRITEPGLCCNVGTVIDLSAGGVRVLSKRRLKGRANIVFDIDGGEKLRIKSKIAWCQRIGFRSYLVGLQFENLPLSAARRLLRQGSCAPSNNGSPRTRFADVGVSVVIGVSLLIAGAAARGSTLFGWLDGIGLSKEVVQAVDQTTYPLVFSGMLLLAISLLRVLPRPTPARRRAKALSRIVEKNMDRRDPKLMLNSILESALGGVLILEAIRNEHDVIKDFHIQTVNPAAEQLLGSSAEDLIGQRLRGQLPCVGPEGLFDVAISVVETGLPQEKQQRLRHDGKWYRYTAVKLGDGLAVTFADVSEQRNAEDKLRHAAYHDALTGLPNRKLLSEHMEKAIRRADRIPGYKFAVLFLDFDRFKIINDSLGHEAGDQLLLGITQRLRDNLRELDTSACLGDAHLPSRLGGDEFVVLLEGVRDDRSAAVVAQRLLDAFAVPYQIAGHEVTSTASIGIVVSNPRYTKTDNILRDADTAMYQAKCTGKAKYVVFDEQMHKAIVHRLKTENDLRAAVEKNAFEVVYEPIVCLQSGRLQGFEALIRWPHPERGTIPPGEFIEIAEELGLITKIGKWILREACFTFVRWRKEHPEHAPKFINVNVSRGQLRDPGLTGQVHAIILETGIDPSMLRLEITESMVMDDLDKMVEVLGRLKDLGVQLAMDDFGTGHSSLTCLHRFPLDVLKIDRSFINSVGRKERYYGAILHSVIELAGNLDMSVIAEGIENANQLALLQGLNCEYGQGWLFSEPVDAIDAEALLSRDFSHTRAA